MAYDHKHNHDHSSTKNIGVAFALNFVFTIFEFFGGIYTNSVAITSDALHDLGDTISLGLSWYFEKISKRKRTKKFSYGYKRFSILGAIINSLVLLTGSVIILFETIPRLFNPVQSDAAGMFWFAVIGIVVNGAAIIRLRRGNSISERVVSLHLMEDVLGWVAVLVGSVVMYFFDLPVIDPLLSVCITVYVLVNVYRNMRSVARVILQGVPENVDMEAIVDGLRSSEGVGDIHDLHVWTMDNRYNVLSVHVVLEPDADPLEVKSRVRKLLLDKYEIEHSTIETETSGEVCLIGEC